MPHEMLDVRAAIKPQRVLNNVQIQTRALCPYSKIIAVRRKMDIRWFPVRIVEERQSHLVRDGEGLLGHLRPCDGRMCSTRGCKHDNQEPDVLPFVREHELRQFL